MKELDDLLKKVGVDKVLHMLSGALICSFITFITIQESGLTWWQKILMPTIGTIIAIFLSLVKEMFLDDTPDWKDVLWTFYGCIAVYVSVGLGILFN